MYIVIFVVEIIFMLYYVIFVVKKNIYRYVPSKNLSDYLIAKINNSINNLNNLTFVVKIYQII